MAEHRADTNKASVPTGSVAGQARGVADEMKGAAADVATEARAAGTSLRDDVAGLGSTLKQGLTDQAERQKNGIADRLSSVASRAEETAADLRRNEAWLGNLLGRGAAELESVAEEIRRNDVAGIMGSVEVFARRQPALFMGASVALGFALTRFVSAGPVSGDDHMSRGGRDYDRTDSQARYPGAAVGVHGGRSDIEAEMSTRSGPIVGGSNI